MSKDATVEKLTAQSRSSGLSTRARVLAVVGGLASLLVLYFLVSVIYCWLHPLDCLESSGRQAFKKQGFTARTRIAGDVPIRIWDSGGGARPLVLLHGQLLSSTVFCLRPFVMPLSGREYRLLAVDLPAHGESGRPPGGLTLAAFEESIAELLRSEGFERPVVLGHGLGGFIAARVAHAHPELVGALVLVEPSGLAPPGPDDPPLLPSTRKQWRSVLRKANPRNRDRTLGDAAVDALLARGRETGLAALYEALQPGDYLHALPWERFTVPTAVIWGEENQVPPPSEGRALAERIPGARFRTVPKAGSAPFVTRPATTAMVLLEVLAALQDGASGTEAVAPPPGGGPLLPSE